MRITQGMFSSLPDLTDVQISAQVQYLIDRGWAVSIEHTDDPHPRNTFWDMWGQPIFDERAAAPIMNELDRCRQAHPNTYIRLSAFDSTKGWESVRASFVVQRPAAEPGFHLIRENGPGRRINYTLRPYATDQPPGERYV